MFHRNCCRNRSAKLCVKVLSKAARSTLIELLVDGGIGYDTAAAWDDELDQFTDVEDFGY